MQVNIPVLIPVDDYHEISYLDDHLRRLNKQLSAVEVGMNFDNGKYYALVYDEVDPPTEGELLQLLDRERLTNSEFTASVMQTLETL